jgi:hypothetical protein
VIRPSLEDVYLNLTADPADPAALAGPTGSRGRGRRRS